MENLGEVKERIKNFVLEELSLDGEVKILNDDDQLLERGIIDSMGILRLLAFLEENYGVLLSTEELNPDNFSTILNIAELVIKKIAPE